MRLAKEFLTFYVLSCESSSFKILWLSVCCVLSGPFATAGSHTVLVVVVRPYTFESRIHKVTVELLNIVEGLVALYADCTSNLSKQMVQRIQLLASSIVPTIQWCYDEIHFSIFILTLTITGLQHFR